MEVLLFSVMKLHSAYATIPICNTCSLTSPATKNAIAEENGSLLEIIVTQGLEEETIYGPFFPLSRRNQILSEAQRFSANNNDLGPNTVIDELCRLVNITQQYHVDAEMIFSEEISDDVFWGREACNICGRYKGDLLEVTFCCHVCDDS